MFMKYKVSVDSMEEVEGKNYPVTTEIGKLEFTSTGNDETILITICGVRGLLNISRDF